MSVEMIALRLLHVVLGIFWAGTGFFMASFLLPGVRATWPAGHDVLVWLESRRFYVAITVAGLLTVLTGLRMYAILSNGFRPGWMSSGPGIAYGAGGLFALAALGVGFAVIRPWAGRLGVALRAGRSGPEVDRAAHGAEAEAALARMTGGVRWVARLLGLAAILMAVGRYL